MNVSVGVGVLPNGCAPPSVFCSVPWVLMWGWGLHAMGGDVGVGVCTPCVQTLENPQFLGPSGPRTLFAIECESAADITAYNAFGEPEVGGRVVGWVGGWVGMCLCGGVFV